MKCHLHSLYWLVLVLIMIISKSDIRLIETFRTLDYSWYAILIFSYIWTLNQLFSILKQLLFISVCCHLIYSHYYMNSSIIFSRKRMSVNCLWIFKSVRSFWVIEFPTFRVVHVDSLPAKTLPVYHKVCLVDNKICLLRYFIFLGFWRDCSN